MIDVQQPVSKDFFVDSLKNKKEIFKNEKIHQTNIYVKQQGAGNGKTYGVVQLIQDKDLAELSPSDLKCVSMIQPTDSQMKDLLFAWKVA